MGGRAVAEAAKMLSRATCLRHAPCNGSPVWAMGNGHGTPPQLRRRLSIKIMNNAGSPLPRVSCLQLATGPQEQPPAHGPPLHLGDEVRTPRSTCQLSFGSHCKRTGHVDLVTWFACRRREEETWNSQYSCNGRWCLQELYARLLCGVFPARLLIIN